jgi:integrase
MPAANTIPIALKRAMSIGFGGIFGLRLNECLSLRVKNLDFAQHQIIVRETRTTSQCCPIALSSNLIALSSKDCFGISRSRFSKTASRSRFQAIYMVLARWCFRAGLFRCFGMHFDSALKDYLLVVFEESLCVHAGEYQPAESSQKTDNSGL